MAEIVNLRRAAKRRARDAARGAADANAALHGESGAARRLRQARAALEARRLERHRLDEDRLEERRTQEHPRVDRERDGSAEE